MTAKERTEAKIGRVCIDCAYNNRLFLTADGKDASNELINELDKRGIVEQPGKLVFEFIPKTATEKVELGAIFRGAVYRRTFVTIYNKEAFNMLMNKLERKKVFCQPGRLVFEFIPGITTSYFIERSEIDNQICQCGHNRFAHIYVYGRTILGGLGNRGRCDVEGCECRNYIPKPEEALK